MIYCDYNATAPLRPEARDAVSIALELGANPSSVHSVGRKARSVVEKARTQIASVIGARGEDIVFTSGGTEANALAINGALALIENPIILTTDLEHPAVKANIEASGVPVRRIAVEGNGSLSLSDLSDQLNDMGDHTPFLILMLANNETGVIQPVADAARVVRDAGGFTHCDAVQALGKLNVNAALLGVDYMAFSSHKLGGPQGAGALWFRVGAPLKPQQLGGGQERSLRSGTENVPGIAGFGAAVSACMSAEDAKRVSAIRDKFESLLSDVPGIRFFGREADRLPGTSNFALEGFKGETQVMAMDLAGIAVSSGSACSSGKVKTSDVLTAMGVEETLANSAIRVSFGWASELKDAEAAAEAWLKAARRAVPEAFMEKA
ncbi:cysteine desulfurase family protein [Ponticaulis sp.]|uniref:cysteine desulfurase family protein n=1 Tax=Ponticaulis sp. TaxID=2020902 RepID=UPI0025D2922A|nr:cysteine desulfurase family protein [Ponticaulis sp.]|tara:strand:+ start:6953 stop:8089 length:1137 start_codon:yes stop_codon:yes gene_type:complete